jgi:hypothetical protein
MQGALFRRLAAVDKRAAAALHGFGAATPRPYTVSPMLCEHEEVRGNELILVDGDRTWFRITGLTAAAATLFLEMSQRTRLWELISARTCARFQLRHWKTHAFEHPWAGQIGYEELWQSAYHDMRRQRDRIWLDFETPTGFDPQPDQWPNWNHLPLAESVFGSLARRQRALLPALAEAGESRRSGRLPATLGEYRIQSHSLHFHQHGAIESGFTGCCEYVIDPRATLEERFRLHLLAGLAFYTGVGMKTSWGMGMTRRSRYADFTYRGNG